MSQAPINPLNYAQPPQQYGAREGFLLRWCAALIDGAICFIPGALLSVVLAKVAGLWLGGVILTLAYIAYSSLEVFKAATPGKMLLKLKITNEDGSEANQQTLIQRWVIKQAWQFARLLGVVTTVMLFNWVALFCWIGYVISCCLTFKPERQALHDTLAHTAVFKTQAAAAVAMPTPEQQPQKQAA